MMNHERKIIGATIPDVEKALFEQYGKSKAREKGRSAQGVTYVVSLSSKSYAKCTITQITEGASLSMSPDIGGAWIVLIVIGLFMFIIPGLFFSVFLVFRMFIISKFIGRGIDNVVRGAEHEVKLRQSSSSIQPPPPPAA